MLSHRGLSKAAANDKTYRDDNNRHPAASWLAHGGRGSHKASSTGDEDKERMTMVLAIVPPDGKTSVVGAKSAVLRRSFAELVEAHTVRSGQEPHTPGGTKSACCKFAVSPGNRGPTLRGAARSRRPRARCGFAVSP